MPDRPENDYFATQFATAIVNESGKQTQYWFGRMLRFLGSDEFVFRNFFGVRLHGKRVYCQVKKR